MRNLRIKKFKNKTNTLFRYRQFAATNSANPTGETDPTNTTITVLTTISGQTHLAPARPDQKD